MQQASLDFKENLYSILSVSPAFSDVARGRQGGILVDVKNYNIPIVRTTTSYHQAPSPFSEVYYEIIEQIKKQYPELKLEFNNAMIEKYNHEYCKMGYHTDQALDLADDSYICLFSCYNDPETKNVRKLIVQNKTTKEEISYNLNHNSIILFSTRVNRENQHKIILDSSNTRSKKNDKETMWLGLTFRLSKTFVTFKEGIPHLLSSGSNKEIFHLANEKERKEFIHYKGQENQTIDFVYPPINYTLSASDLLPPNSLSL